MIFAPISVLVLMVAGMLAGTLGALVGIGGGILLIPILTIGFGVDMRVATATSLVVVVATSTATGSVYVGAGLANMRLGMTLEVATSVGGVTGGLVAALLPTSVLMRVFAVLLTITAILMLRGKKDAVGDAKKAKEEIADPPRASGTGVETGTAGNAPIGTLAGEYYDDREKRVVSYHPVHVAFGSAVALLAGVLSGLLGIGGGFLKVPAMNLGMRVPLRVAAATSNFMMGVTAAASLFVYFARGDVHPLLAAPVALGVAGGSLTGAHLSKTASPRLLRTVLAVVLLVVSAQMILRGSAR